MCRHLAALVLLACGCTGDAIVIDGAPEPAPAAVPAAPASELSADLAMTVSGVGRYLGQDQSCAADPRGGFDAIVAATATYSITTRRWRIASVDPVSLSITTTGGCEVEGIEIDVLRRVHVTALAPTGATSCDLYCESDATCMVSCLGTLGGELRATAELVTAPIELDAGTCDALRLQPIELRFEVLIDAAGSVIERRPHDPGSGVS